MAGKAPYRRKDKTRNSRPYDRPNQGIFGRVASKVKDLLTPSWFFSVPNWMRTEEVDGTSPTNQIDEDDLTENEEEPIQVKSTSKPRLPIRPAKRMRYDNNVSHVTIDESPSLPWPGPSTSRERAVIEIEDRECTPIIPNCDIRKKDSQVIVNGDDHSENSDNSASTSGCSSLISSQEKPHRSSSLKLSESALKHLRGELKRKSTFSSSRQDMTLPSDMFSSSISRLNESRITTLWSCGTQTPIKSFPQRPSPSNRPSFNVSSFGRTTMMNNAPNLKISSPFYEGNTTYGGASAYRKKSLAPYQINSAKSLKNQIKVKENTSNEGVECMSSAARRILHTLERMSTPISDAKRIPNVTQSPLNISSTLVPPSHRMKCYLSAPSTSTTSSKGPPIVNLSAVSKVPLLKNRNSRITRNSMMEIPIQPCSPSILEDCLTKPTKDSQDTSSNRSPGGGGGKMKTKRHTLHSSRTKDAEESAPDYDLPDVPLPIRSMPVFKQDSPLAENNSVNRKSKEPEEPSFTFSSPIEYSMPSATSHSPKITVTSSYKFSPPLVVTPEAKPIQETTNEEQNNSGLILSGSVNDILKNMRDSKKPSNFSKGQEKLTANDDAIASTSTEGFGDIFKPKPGAWTCSVCLLQNDGVKCVACETPRQTATKAKIVENFPTTSGFADKFKPQAGSWECPTCMVRNTYSDEKCVACGTDKSCQKDKLSEKKEKDSFSVPYEPGNWTCGTCLVKNKPSAVKCIACETPKAASNAQIIIEKGFADKFKPEAGSWECPTCMVRNTYSNEKCVACGTDKSSQKDKLSGKKEKDSFGVTREPGNWTCGICFVKNKPSAVKCIACETYQATSNVQITIETGFADKFKPQAGSWECPTCMVRNTYSDEKCVACGTYKSCQKDKLSGKKGKVEQKASDSKLSGVISSGGKLVQNNADTWRCDTCLVRNPSSSTKCVACETQKPSKAKSSTKDGQKPSDSKMSSISSTGGNLFQNNADTWECDTCLVRNASSSTKCVACETIKSSKGKSSTDANFGFKFGANTQNSSSSFAFGSLISTSVPTSVTTTPKFGISDSTSKPTIVAPETFKFGVPLQTSKTTISESGFKFGDSSQASKASIMPSAIFGSQSPDKTLSDPSAKNEPAQDSMKLTGGIKFGMQPIPTSTNEEKVNSITTAPGLFNINKPIGFTNSSAESSEFKLSDSAATGFKFGETTLGKSDKTKTKPDDGKQTQPPAFVAPALIFGSNTPSTIHSTADTENKQTASNASISSIVSEPPSTVLSKLKPVAPFSFGTPTTTVASSVSLSGNSNVSTFGQFGENTAKPKEPSPFEMIKKPIISAPSLLSQNIKTATIPSSGITPFNFNPPTFNTFPASTSQAETKSTSTLLTTISTVASSMPVFTNFGSTPSTFVFGGQNASTTTTSIFTFGAPVQAASSTLAAPVPSTNTSNFGFNATSTTESKSGFAIKPNEEKKLSLFASPSTPAFGTTNPPAVSAPFQFGAKTSTATGGFGFSTPKQDIASTQGKFAFGAGEAAKPSFTAFPLNQPTTMASTMSSFNFGGNPSNSSSAFKPASSKFAFGAKTASSAATNPPPVFGSPAPPVFGANTSSPAFGSTVAPAFGNISAVPKLPEPSGGFNFSATSAPTAASTPFVFGASAEKKPAMGAAPTTGFNFMAAQPPQSDPSNTNFSADFSMSTPQTFNFGATSSLTSQPFQFAAVGEGNSNPTTTVTGARRIRRAVRRGIRKD